MRELKPTVTPPRDSTRVALAPLKAPTLLTTDIEERRKSKDLRKLANMHTLEILQIKSTRGIAWF